MLSFAEITDAFDNFHRQVWTFFDSHPSERGIETVGEGYLLDTSCYIEATGTFDNADCLIGGDDSYDCYDYLNNPRTCGTSKNNGPVKEEAVISDRDGMLYRYSADFAGVFGYDIYPLRDGRSFVKEIDHDAGDGELNIKEELLSAADTKELIRRIMRWRHIFKLHPFSVNEKDKTVTIGNTKVKIVSDMPLPPIVLNAIGLGFSLDHVEAAIKEGEEPFLVLVARDVDEMTRLCDRVERCTVSPKLVEQVNSIPPITGVGGFCDTDGNLFHVYIRKGEKTSTGRLAQVVQHEAWHLVGGRFVEDDHTYDAYDAFVPLLVGFLSATGHPKESVERIIRPDSIDSVPEEIRSFSFRWADCSLNFVAEDTPIDWKLIAFNFPVPIEWYARMGTCLNWDQKCYDIAAKFYPPIVKGFSLHASVSDPFDMKETLSDSRSPMEVQDCTKLFAFESEVDNSSGGRTYFLGPYKVIGDWEGQISQISLGEMPVSRDDPGFVDFMAHYNIDPAQEISLAAAEVYIRLLNECGGIDWKYSDDCLGEIDKLKDLSRDIGYRVSNYNGDRTSVFSHIVDNAKFLVAGSEYGLTNLYSAIDHYYFMNSDIDKIAELEVDVMVERLKAILGEDVYRQFAESFYLRVAEEQDDGIEKKDLFKRWLANKLMGISLCQPPAPFCPL